jgi:hypothetical protein
MEKTLDSLLLLEETLLQEKIDQPKERLQRTLESGKLQRRTKPLMQRKKDKCLRRKEKSSKETKVLHQRHDQKYENIECLIHLISQLFHEKEKR